jgi:hypothetical protein
VLLLESVSSDGSPMAACMIYVDLDPIGANMADRPEQSDFTSAKRRIEKAKNPGTSDASLPQPKSLSPFAGNSRQDMPSGLPFRLTDYLELLDWTGRIMREDKRGAIPSDLPSILTRLQIDPRQWVYASENFESRFKRFVGSWYAVKNCCPALGYSRTPGLAAAKLLS